MNGNPDEKAGDNEEPEEYAHSSDGAVEGDVKDQSPPPQGISSEKPVTGVIGKGHPLRDALLLLRGGQGEVFRAGQPQPDSWIDITPGRMRNMSFLRSEESSGSGLVVHACNYKIRLGRWRILRYAANDISKCDGGYTPHPTLSP